MPLKTVTWTLLLALLACLPARARERSAPSALLLREAERELRAVRASAYQHRTAVDEAAGSFRFDCSGFVTFALRRALPAEARAIAREAGRRPLAEDYFQLIKNARRRGPRGLRRVERVQDLRPGDLVVWLKPESSLGPNTGHIMVVRDRPRASPARGDEALVRVIDSTESPHAADTRPPGASGLGSGTIGLVLSPDGAPRAYRWRGGLSRTAVATPIVLGRLE